MNLADGGHLQELQNHQEMIPNLAVNQNAINQGIQIQGQDIQLQGLNNDLNLGRVQIPEHVWGTWNSTNQQIFQQSSSSSMPPVMGKFEKTGVLSLWENKAGTSLENCSRYQ